ETGGHDRTRGRAPRMVSALALLAAPFVASPGVAAPNVSMPLIDPKSIDLSFTKQVKKDFDIQAMHGSAKPVNDQLVFYGKTNMTDSVIRWCHHNIATGDCDICFQAGLRLGETPPSSNAWMGVEVDIKNHSWN